MSGRQERVAGAAEVLGPYLPTLTRRWIAEHPERTHLAVDGSLALVDVSGFTKLSERLARLGPVGAEELTETIDSCFARLLAVAYANDGSLMKFGGDALLLLFTGAEHQAKACRATLSMRQTLRDIGQLETTAGRVALRMSIGVHSGEFHFYLVGESHRELIIAGPAATETVRMESAADAGEVLVSEATAAALPATALGALKGPGQLLRRTPRGLSPLSHEQTIHLGDDDVLRCVPLAIREHLRSAASEPEHRRATVAFLRFEGTDEVVTREGPAVLGERLHRLVTDVQSAVDQYGVAFIGTDIDRAAGKIILATGAPVRHDNDEERMLLALRDIADRHHALPLRIGVNRGDVFAGDVGPPYRRTYTLMGDTVNLAARVMSKASPGQVLATRGVLDGSGMAFDTVALEPFMVKGKRHPVQASRVEGVAGRRSDGPAQLPLIGRDEELQHLRDAVAGVRAGNGRMVQIVGEPGLGKSRLVEELRTDTADLTTVSLSCQLYEESTGYSAFRVPLLRLLDLGEHATEGEISRRLDDVVLDPDLIPWLPLVGLVLGVTLPDTVETAQLDDQFRRGRLHRVLFSVLQQLLTRPTIVTVEDAHWMDEPSADLLAHLAGRLDEVPWLICTTRRDVDSGFAPPDTIGGDMLRLSPLDGGAAAALARAATEASPLSAHNMDSLVERAGGNPLFLTELVAAAEAGGMDDLPDTVEAVITSRIDGLPSRDRQLLRHLAVLGPTFPRDLAAAALGVAAADADAALGRLSQFVHDDGVTVRFAHGLIRDAAYGGLSYRLRRRLHAEVGDTIERSAGLDSDSQAELLSFHFFHAQRYAEAWRYSLVAAERARSVYANGAATTFYQRALEASLRIPELVPGEVARVHEALGDVHELMGAYAQAAAAYRACRPFITGEPVAQARMLTKIARTQAWLGRYSPALRSIRRALNGLEGVESAPAASQRAQSMVWYARFCHEAGRPAAAIDWCKKAITASETAGDDDALAHAYKILDWSYMELGRTEQAVYSPKALALYEALGDLAGQAALLNNMGAIAYWKGQWQASLELYERALELYRRTGSELGVALAWGNMGEVLSDQGRWTEAETLFRDALRLWQAGAHRSGVAKEQRNLGRVASRLHHHDEARRLFAEVIAQFEDVGARVEVLETQAQLAEDALLAGDADDALQCADTALDHARALGGVETQLPLLQRVRGRALLERGDLDAAEAALTESLTAADEHNAEYEVALTLRALADLAEAQGDGDRRTDYLERSEAILHRLDVIRTPEAEPAGV